MTLIRRILSFVVCAALLCSSALAQDLSSAVGAYLQNYDSLRFHLSAQVETLTPYGEETIAMMNAFLKHASLSAAVSQETMALKVQLGDETVADFAQRGEALTTSLLPKRELRGADALNTFLPEEEEASFDFFAAVAEAETCYQQLTDAIVPYAEEKKASYSIKNVGSSRWSRIARLTPEQADMVGPMIAQLLGCGMDEAFREQLRGMTYSKGFIVGLYQTAQGGDDLAVYIKGDVTFPDGVKRSISYQWAFAVKENGNRVDSYKFDMTKAKTPRDNRQISGFFKRRADKQLLLDGESKAIVRSAETGLLTTATLTCDLAGQSRGGESTAEGSVSYAVRVSDGENGSTSTLTVSPKVTISKEGAITGKVDVKNATGSTVHTLIHLTLNGEAAAQDETLAEIAEWYAVADMPQSSLTQNLYPAQEEDYLVGEPPIGYAHYDAPERNTVVHLDQAGEDDLAALEQELLQNLAGRLLKAAFLLPEEAIAIIRDGMTDADFAALQVE